MRRPVGCGGPGGGRGGGGFGGPGGAGAGTGGQTGATGQTGQTGQPPQGGFGGQNGATGGGGAGGPGGGSALGGLLDAGTPSQALVTLLQQDASSYGWVAAAVGANSAAGVQLAAGEPVLAIGGFNGSDPAPTLAQFQELVAQGRIHYFLAGGSGGAGRSRRWRRRRDLVGDHQLGRADVHVDHGRRRDGVRPDRVDLPVTRLVGRCGR